MTERPIIMDADSVRAILAGRKGQTRRVVKPQPELALPYPRPDFPACPYGTVGDAMWVKETWRPALSDTHDCYAYRADMRYRCGVPIPEGGDERWRSPLVMPRHASRLLLRVESVRVERVQDISEADAMREGVERPVLFEGPVYDSPWGPMPTHPMTGEYRDGFRAAWDALRGYPWDANPWVWVLGFAAVEEVRG